MDKDRRGFLKTAGFSIVGIGCGAPAVSALADVLGASPNPGAMQGKRWGMVIDTRKCGQKDGCKDCMQACHVAHNVPTLDDPNRSVKWIWKETYEHTFHDQVHEYTDHAVRGRDVLVLCNHCDNPPCVRVCPTQATWKRDDGLVMMDQHRCIGCRFCVVGCPYGSRSFNWQDPRPHIAEINSTYPTRTKGVVEKCNFCAERLAKGQGPACVEACQKLGVNAMLFGDLADSKSEIATLLGQAYTIRRKPGLGTSPHVFYIV